MKLNVYEEVSKEGFKRMKIQKKKNKNVEETKPTKTAKTT